MDKINKLNAFTKNNLRLPSNVDKLNDLLNELLIDLTIDKNTDSIIINTLHALISEREKVKELIKSFDT